MRVFTAQLTHFALAVATLLVVAACALFPYSTGSSAFASFGVVAIGSLAGGALLMHAFYLLKGRTLQFEVDELRSLLKDHFFVIESDAEGQFIDANEKYLKRIGMTIEELRAQPKGGLCDGSRLAYLQDMWSQVCSGQAFSGEFQDRAADGAMVSIRAIVAPWLRPTGGIKSIWTIGIDVSDQKAAETEAKEAAARLANFIKHAPAAVAMFDKDMRYVAHTDRWLEDYQLPQTSLVGLSHYDVFPEVLDHWREKHQRILAGATERSDEERFKRADGSENIIRWEVRPWYLPDESVGGVMMLTEEITKQKLLKDELWRLAHIDSTTGLPNRRHFNTCLRQAIDTARTNGGSFALALVDVDKLKDINDTLGHDAGDALLAEIGNRLQRAAELGGIAARLGGDEFALLIDESNPEVGRERVFAALQEAMKQPVEIEGISRHCSLSLGAALFPHDAEEASELLKRADLALYRAKELGRDRIVYFSSNLQQCLKNKVDLQHEAIAALESDEFVLFYQPVVSVDPDKPICFEALLRWDHPIRGLMAPGSFDQIFDDNKVARTLGKRVMDLAVRQISDWEASKLPFGRVAFNVISADFADGAFAERLEEKLALYGVSAARVCVEVTERVFLGAGSAHVAEALKKLHALGVEIALDDFGTGYASLSHIRAYPIDRLKIDRSFVRDMATNSDDLSIVQAIVHLGSSLGLSITAEGVESDQHVALLKALGCGSLQGYFFSRPVSPESISGWVSRESVRALTAL
jgi:diguanylate cyclase (GGDEF)-like protein/PAS domain S-box-containing protein